MMLPALKPVFAVPPAIVDARRIAILGAECGHCLLFGRCRPRIPACRTG